MSTLTQPAVDLIKASGGTPYFNNSRERMRMGLRAQVGKGTPEEISEEAQLAAFREHIDLAVLAPQMRKNFLVSHKFGVDCSGFAYHILDAEARARGLGPLYKHLNFPYSASLLSSFGRSLRRRYAENCDVRTFAHTSNSREIPLAEIAPGDFLIRLAGVNQPSEVLTKEGPFVQRDHIIIVTAVDGPNITLAQSEARPEDGRYNHGVRVETLPLTPLPPALATLPLHRLNWL